MHLATRRRSRRRRRRTSGGRSSCAACIESTQAERAFNGEQVDVGVAEVKRLSDELHRLGLEEELADRSRRLATPDHEEGAEHARFELRCGTRIAQRDVESRRE